MRTRRTSPMVQALRASGPTHEPKLKSLRERKKAQQRSDLLRIAAELFRSKGYENTRMEDIADLAQISTKTVYNYFSTKQQVIIELLTEDRQVLTRAYAEIVENPPKDPAEALALLFRADLGDVRSHEDKKLWRELLAAETRTHDRAEDGFDTNRRSFVAYIERLLASFQKRGELSRKVSLPIAADMIYAIYAHDFRQFCALASATPDDVLKMARQQMKLLLSAWQ